MCDNLDMFLLGAIIAGLMIGVIPLITGFVKGKIMLGIIGFVVCFISAIIAGALLGIPVCIAFMYYILKKPKEINNQTAE